MPWNIPAGRRRAACWAACSADVLFATYGQGWIFLWMLAAGAAIGAWYACLAALRRLLCAGAWLSLAADLAFGAGAAVIFCLALVAANYGRLRLYAVLAALAGFALFSAGVFPPAKRFAPALARGLRQIVVTIGQYRWIKVIFK